MVYTSIAMTSKKMLLFSTIIFIVFLALLMVWFWDKQPIVADAALVANRTIVSNDEYMTTHPFIEESRKTENALLVDIRTPEEYASGHIEGAINIDFYSPLFMSQLLEVAEGKRLFIYCRSGSRTSSAYRQLVNLGLDVSEMRGGILSYKGALVR
jgi:rhodanese-related sulfurtransferase